MSTNTPRPGDTEAMLLRKIANILEGSLIGGGGGGGLPVVLGFPKKVGGTAVASVAASSGAAQTIRAASATRVGLLVFNNDANPLFLKYGSGASTSDFSVKIAAGGYWEMPQPIYTGIVTGIWSGTVTDAAKVTELTE